MDQTDKQFGYALFFRGAGIYILVQAVENGAHVISTTYQYISMRFGLPDPWKKTWTLGDNYTFFKWSWLEGDLLSYWVSFLVLLFTGYKLLTKADFLANRLVSTDHNDENDSQDRLD